MVAIFVFKYQIRGCSSPMQIRHPIQSVVERFTCYHGYHFGSYLDVLIDCFMMCILYNFIQFLNCLHFIQTFVCLIYAHYKFRPGSKSISVCYLSHSIRPCLPPVSLVLLDILLRYCLCIMSTEHFQRLVIANALDSSIACGQTPFKFWVYIYGTSPILYDSSSLTRVVRTIILPTQLPIAQRQ